ncbi:hypothetical protein FISHEDRAFT_62776 [Fistulina hepatica ATCC 64428]|nr:hypothetical protein FISHEDRAFT_62776 [Fistulina hepatica ATCC 64428]
MCGTRVRYCEVRKCSNSKCRSEVPSGEVVTSAYFDSSESSLFYLWWLSRLMPRTNIFGPPPKPKKPPRPAADEDSDPEGAAELAQLKAETRRIEHRRTCKKYYFEHHDEVLDRAAERRARKKEEIKSIYFEEEHEQVKEAMHVHQCECKPTGGNKTTANWQRRPMLGIEGIDQCDLHCMLPKDQIASGLHM